MNQKFEDLGCQGVFILYHGRKYFLADGLTWATINKDTNKAQIIADDAIDIEKIINGTLLYTIDNEKEPQIYCTLKLDE